MKVAVAFKPRTGVWTFCRLDGWTLPRTLPKTHPRLARAEVASGREETAEGSAVKAAAYLDLCVSKGELDAEQNSDSQALSCWVASC